MTRAEAARIKAKITAMTAEERTARLEDLSSVLTGLGDVYAKQGIFTEAQQSEFDAAVEEAVRLEGFDRGRGFTWRALRRVTLKRAFLSQSPPSN